MPPPRRARSRRAAATDRGGQALGEAEHDGVDRGDQRGGVDAEGDGGVEDPGAVTVDREAVAAGGAGHRLDLGDGPRHAPGGHVGVLDGHEAERRQVVGRALGGGVDGRRLEGALPVVEGADLDAGVHCRSGRLVLADVGPGRAEHLGPPPGQEA
jgi:hypothetical protein